MEYSQVDKDQKIQMLKGRILGWESEHFGHEINLTALEAVGSSDLEKASSVRALEVLEASILAGRAKLAELESE